MAATRVETRVALMVGWRDEMRADSTVATRAGSMAGNWAALMAG